MLTGAGVSAESGLPTFRDSGGLWEQYDVYELASPEGWAKNQGLVLDFYNYRRQKVREASPNEAHRALVKLEEKYNVHIITQNIDNLHEKAGSSQILHLHGEIMKAQSSVDETLVYELGDKDIKLSDTCEKGSQLRPFVVWFGESVPMLEKAIKIVRQADIFIVIGTSLAVYPAASLINYVPSGAGKYIVDKEIPAVAKTAGITAIEETAVNGVPPLVEKLNGKL